MPENSISYIVKRSGKRVLFNEHKIMQAVLKAMEAVREPDEKDAERVKALVVRKLNEDFDERMPTVEDVQDRVETALLELKLLDVAKAYILYRNERARLRAQKAELTGGKVDEMDLDLNALKLLEQRYLQRDAQGDILETPSELFWRVADAVAMAELKYNADPKAAARGFYRLMANLEFLPSSPVLMNAGTTRQLSSCFAIPLPDDVDAIFAALRQAALVQKNGGGTGFSFSRIRPRGDIADGLGGVAAGPIAFMRIFEAAMNAIKQSGRRQGANMGVLRVDHPDILDFINLKLTRTMQNFNLSVAVTDAFMDALEKGGEYDLVNPRTGKKWGSLSARVVFDSILAVSWRCGDPGVLFIDRMNAANPCKGAGSIETTSACGEQPLMPYESCNEGSVNLAACLKDGDEGRELDIAKLRRIVARAVRFLDNAIDINNYPVKEVEKMAKATRRIGLGVMGFADALYALRVPYDSEEAEQLAERIMSAISDEARKASEELAQERGAFLLWRGSDHERRGKRMRNSGLTGIAPTGTTSLIANVSSGIEPNYALAYSRTVAGGGDLLYLNPYFERAVEDLDKDAVRKAGKRGMVLHSDDLPDEIKRVFKTAQQIPPEWHIRIQAAFQKHVDGAISKTINFPSNASVKDLEDGFLLAWKLGCKGITVYRDSSLEQQVITAGG